MAANPDPTKAKVAFDSLETAELPLRNNNHADIAVLAGNPIQAIAA
jgi:hypothetical protein